MGLATKNKITKTRGWAWGIVPIQKIIAKFWRFLKFLESLKKPWEKIALKGVRRGSKVSRRFPHVWLKQNLKAVSLISEFCSTSVYQTLFGATNHWLAKSVIKSFWQEKKVWPPPSLRFSAQLRWEINKETQEDNFSSIPIFQPHQKCFLSNYSQ